MTREILVNANPDETRVAVVENGQTVEFYLERASSQKNAGSIYVGKVVNVLPGMQAAFVDIGEDKNAFLYVDDADLPPELLEAAPEHFKARGKRARTINELVHQGQSVMVQVVKEAIGTKGARVTRHVTFPGRYLVLMPTVNYIGVSRRIASDAERQRLRKIAREIKPENMGVIIRTAAEGKSSQELANDLGFLVKVWEKVRDKASHAKPPSLVHRDLGLAFRIVRDELNKETARMLVDDVNTYGKILELLDTVAPEMKDKVIYYRDKTLPLFELYGVETAISKALGRQVWLKSGGYLVIDKTEALTVIDVNTGRYVGSKNLADTVFKTNLEACEEIARQLRLRDVGGIIIIDFIDMDNPEHRNKILAEMEKQLKKDHTKTVVLGFTGLGLLEMTRKKVRQGLDASLMRECPVCRGRGSVLSEETVAFAARREIRKVARLSQSNALFVEVHSSVAPLLAGKDGSDLKELEEETGKRIVLQSTDAVNLDSVTVRPMDNGRG